MKFSEAVLIVETCLAGYGCKYGNPEDTAKEIIKDLLKAGMSPPYADFYTTDSLPGVPVRMRKWEYEGSEND